MRHFNKPKSSAAEQASAYAAYAIAQGFKVERAENALINTAARIESWAMMLSAGKAPETLLPQMLETSRSLKDATR